MFISQKNFSRQSQNGFTLLEVLVAMLLGIAILTATISMQLQHRRGFKLSSNLLEMQTGAKFAFEFVSQSLRSAGSLGCKNSLAYVGDAESENGRCLSGFCIAFNDPTVAFADFRQGFEVIGYEYTGGGFVPALPTDFQFVSSNYYNSDSDALTVTGGYGEVYPTAQQQDINEFSNGVQLDMSNIDAIRLSQSQYGILSSCSGATVFKVTSSDADISSGNIQWASGASVDDNASGQLGEQSVLSYHPYNSEFRRAAVTTYYVGMHPFNDATGVPTLYQDVDGVSSRLIEGVEEMHVLFGLSENPDIRNVADRYVTADVVESLSSSSGENRWADVVSVRIGLIMRSAAEVFENDQTVTTRLDCVNYSQSVKTDKYARKSYCAEVSLRNRLTGVRSGRRN